MSALIRIYIEHVIAAYRIFKAFGQRLPYDILHYAHQSPEEQVSPLLLSSNGKKEGTPFSPLERRASGFGKPPFERDSTASSLFIFLVARPPIGAFDLYNIGPGWHLTHRRRYYYAPRAAALIIGCFDRCPWGFRYKRLRYSYSRVIFGFTASSAS